jgi:hypothetical protein
VGRIIPKVKPFIYLPFIYFPNPMCRRMSSSKTYLQVYQTRPTSPTKWPSHSATSWARSTNSTGYISTISLSPTGSLIKQLFLEPTTSSGGTVNSVAPAFFSDEWAALKDSSVGFVQVWRATANGSSAEAVATVQIDDGGCCANAIWCD